MVLRSRFIGVCFAGVSEVFKRTSCIADLKPAGRFVAKDLVECSSVPLLTKTLLDSGFMHGSATVTGCTVAENMNRRVWDFEPSAVHPAGSPVAAANGGLRGSLAPEAATIKMAGTDDEEFSSAAGGFDSEEARFDALQNRKCGEAQVIRPSRRVRLRNDAFEKRRAAWQPRGSWFGSGYFWKYAHRVGTARHGAITHPGRAAEKACYADI